MVLINIDKLREYMLDYVGEAAFGGLPAAIIDTMEIQDMDPKILCKKAENLGIDLNEFKIDNPEMFD